MKRAATPNTAAIITALAFAACLVLVGLLGVRQG